MTPITGASFADEERLKTHERFECGRRSVEICTNTNSDFEAEKKTTEQSESGDESISSDVKNDRNGGRIYKNRDSVSKPKKKKTPSADKNYECIYCRQRYITKNSLSRHVIDHGIF